MKQVLLILVEQRFLINEICAYSYNQEHGCAFVTYRGYPSIEDGSFRVECSRVEFDKFEEDYKKGVIC